MSKKTKIQLELDISELIASNNEWMLKFSKLQCENNDLKQQIKEGQLVFHYKEKNEHGAGRKKIVSEEIKNEIYKWYESMWSMDKIARKFKLSKGTIFNVIHEFD